MGEYEETEKKGNLGWDDVLVLLATLGIVDKGKKDRLMIGYEEDTLIEIAQCFHLNVCKPVEASALIQKGKRIRYSDIKIAGSAVPVPALHTLVIYKSQDIDEGHVVLVTNRSLARAHGKVMLA